jgi:hypothetical protein
VRPLSFKTLFALPGLILLLTACGPREISEKKMEAIIRDVFMANAWYSQFGSREINTDSVDFYTPILKKYGYGIDDFRHTLDRWAMKKSSRLSDLIDQATADIQRENLHFQHEELLRLRADTLITARYLDTLIFRPDSLLARRARDRDSLIFRMPAVPGSYRLRYGYDLSPADQNNYLIMRYNLRDSVGRAVGSNSYSLLRNGRKNYIDAAFQVDEKVDSIEIILANYPEKPKDMGLRIDSILLTYNQPIEALRERFMKDMIRIELGIDFPYELNYPPKDSGALRVVPPLRPDTAAHSDL